jgi:hypothetical protein
LSHPMIFFGAVPFFSICPSGVRHSGKWLVGPNSASNRATCFLVDLAKTSAKEISCSRSVGIDEVCFV